MALLTADQLENLGQPQDPAQAGGLLNADQLEQLDTPKKSTGILSNIEQGILNIGGGVERGLGKIGAESITHPSQDLAARMVGGQAPTMQQSYGAIPAAPFAQTQSPLYQASEVAAHYSPDIAGGAALLKGGLGLGLRGLSKLTGKNITDAKSLFSQLPKDILKNDYYKNKDYIGDVGKEELKLGNVIKENYNTQKDVGATQINNSLKEIGNNKVAGDLRVSKFKDIDKLNDFTDGKVGALLKKSIKTFKDDPTYNNLHWLQSKIGAKSRELNSFAKDRKDLDDINSLDEIQSKIKNHIVSKAGKSYKDSLQNWAENVVPYEKDRVMNKWINNNQMSKFSGRLTKTSGDFQKGEGNALDKIISHMNSEQKDTAILPALSKGAVDTDGNVNGEKLLDNLLSLRGKGYGKFIDKNEMQNINKLRSAQENILKQKKLTEKLRSWGTYGATGALGALLGKHYL